jgi:hypothetical protein
MAVGPFLPVPVFFVFFVSLWFAVVLSAPPLRSRRLCGAAGLRLPTAPESLGSLPVLEPTSWLSRLTAVRCEVQARRKP